MSDDLALTPLPPEAESNELIISGLNIPGDPQENLCLNAWALLKTAFPDRIGCVRLELRKQIPAGAGLGGGSSDAAATLRLLNDAFELGLSAAELAPFAAQLGADVPFFLYDGPMFAEGIGDRLAPWPDVPPFRIEIKTPDVHSDTATAYRNLDLAQCDPNRDLRAVLRQPPERWRGALVNDFEREVFARFPELAELKRAFYERGAAYASMTGSGAAIYGLFEA